MPSSPVPPHLHELTRLLAEVCKAPRSFLADESLLAALKSQGALAKYSSADLGIKACSLNTLKKRAESDLAGGFLALDRLRLSALKSFDAIRAQESKSTKTTKAGLAMRVLELENDIVEVRCDLEILSDALERSLRQARTYADQAGPVVKERCKKEQREILSLLGLRGQPRIRSVG